MRGESDPVGVDIERIRRELQHAVINIVTTAQSVESAAQALLSSIAAALRWDCTALWIVDGEVIRCVETWSVPDRGGEACVAATSQVRMAVRTRTSDDWCFPGAMLHSKALRILDSRKFRFMRGSKE